MPFSFIVTLLLSLFFLFSAPGQTFANARCIDWPRVMTEQELQSLPSGPSILVQEFKNQTERPEDAWLSLGIRNFLADLLRTGGKIRVFSGITARLSSTLQPDFIIDGSFQVQQGVLRLYISVKEKRGKLASQHALTFPYPKHRDFFPHIADSAKKLFVFFNTPYDALQFDRIRDATISTECYENYTQGRETLETYAPEKIEQALVWFQEAKRADYQSPLGYQGVVDTHIFWGLYKKQNQDNFALHVQKAEEELARMVNLAKRTPSPRSLPKKPKALAKSDLHLPLENRFLQGHAAFVEGIQAKKEGNTKKAEAAFEQATLFIPEDALSWYELSLMANAREKRALSKQAMRKATQLDSCLEPQGSEK